MKTEEKPDNIKTSHLFEEESCGIGDTAKILGFLRENLYTDPIMACVREVSTNARDANREVGKGEIPIKVQLPTAISPVLKISDCGPGISPDRLTNVVLKYGNTTKSNTNDLTGGFGLGAKSPWAYTDNFTIISIFEGIKRSYSAVKSKEGKTILLAEEETNEPSGVTIEIPVKNWDYSKFKEAAAKIYRFWDVQPEVIGSYKSEMPETLIDRKDQGYRLYNANNYSFGNYNSGAAVVIDGIPYEIDSNAIYSNPGWDSKEYRLAQFFKITGLILYFNNGDLSLAISRDNLHYDERTIEKIQKRIEFFADDLILQINLLLKTKSTYFEAASFLKDLSIKLSNNIIETHIGNVFGPPDPNKKEVMWNGLPIKFTMHDATIGEHCKIFLYPRSIKKHRYETKNFNTFDKNVKKYISYSYSPDRKLVNYAGNGSEVLMICVPVSLIMPDQSIIRPTYNQALLDLFDLPSIEDVVIPPHLKKARAEYSRISSDEDYSNIVGSRYTKTNQTYNPTLVPNSGGVYVEYDVASKNLLNKKGNVCYINSNYYDLFSEIYLFTKSRIKHLTEGWRALEDAVVDKIKNMISQYSIEDFKITEDDFEFSVPSNFRDSLYRLNDTDNEEEMEKFQNSDIGQFLFEKRRIERVQSNDEIRLIKSCLRQECCLELKNNFQYENLNSRPLKIEFLEQRILQKYTLLNHIGYNTPLEEIKKYITMVDKE